MAAALPETAATSSQPASTPAIPSRSASSHVAPTRSWYDRLREPLIVAALLLVLEIVVFRDYFTGAVIPQFDFMGGYNLEAFAWWRDGSFFDPTQWMPYMWGGYPAVSNLQNSSYYLPVGLASMFGDFSLHASAILSALHVAFGAVGVYVFIRRWKMGVGVAVIGLTLWFFASGHYASATYPDIARAYAWIPWIMLVTSAKWPWDRWWAAIAAVVILWQSILGIYPGMLIAIGYTIPIWILGNQIAFRPKLRRYLVPLAVVGIAALLMSMLRFLPALMERGTYPAVIPDSSEMNLAGIGTFLFPYENPLLLWYPSMRSFFLPAITLALVVFAPLRDKLTRVLLAVVAVTVVLGLPNWPWHDAVTEFLPGMEASRFRLNDFKFIFLFALVILAAKGFTAVIRNGLRSTRARWIYGAVLVLLNAGFAAIGIRYSYAPEGSIPQWLILAASSALVYLIATGWWKPRQRVIAATLVILATLSGVTAVFSSTYDWRTDRVAAEESYYGEAVDEMIADGAAIEGDVESVRPERIAAPAEITGPDSVDPKYGSVFYTDETSVVGYVNLRGTETFELVKQQLGAEGEVGVNTLAFWQAEGMVIESLPDTVPTVAAIDMCLDTGQCGGSLVVEPVDYDEGGTLVYDLTLIADVAVMLNEAGYEGWTAELCAADAASDCTSIETVRGTSGQITLDVPEGEWRLTMEYRLPGQDLAWILFAAGSFVAIALGALAFVIDRRRRPRHD